MMPARDAFGLEIWSFLRGGSPYEIVERDDGLISTAASVRYYFSDFEHWNTRQKLAMRYVKGRRALDVGCGAGRVALYLQKKRIHVVAMDNSPLAIRACRKRGVKHATLRAIEQIGCFRSGQFDTVVMFGHNFGLFGNSRKAKRLLKTMHRITSEHGVILAESMDPYDTRDPVHLQYHRRNRRLGRMPGQLRMRVRFRTSIGRWFDYLFVSPDEMTEIVHGTGWTIARVITDGSSSYIAILQKAAALAVGHAIS